MRGGVEPGRPKRDDRARTGRDRDARAAEHDRWIEDRLRQGWRFGLRRDVAAKLSPYLVAWEELAEGVRDLDRDSVRAIPHLLAESGLKIVRRPREPE